MQPFGRKRFELLDSREGMVSRKVLLANDLIDGGWSTAPDDPEQKLFLLGYKPFIENIELLRDKLVSSHVTNAPIRPELEYEFDDVCFDGDWEFPLIASSTHLLYVHVLDSVVRMLVEGFVRDWVLRFGRTWEVMDKPSFPSLGCIGSLRVQEFVDDGQGFVVEADYSSSFVWERILRRSDIDKRKWMKWKE